MGVLIDFVRILFPTSFLDAFLERFGIDFGAMLGSLLWLLWSKVIPKRFEEKKHDFHENLRITMDLNEF